MMPIHYYKLKKKEYKGAYINLNILEFLTENFY